MADKLRTQQQLEQLQSRYIGTGHADTTKYEWTSNIHRDSLASYIGHPPLLAYMAVGLGEPKEKVRAQCIEKMIQPVGKPPEVNIGCFSYGPTGVGTELELNVVYRYKTESRDGWRKRKKMVVRRTVRRRGVADVVQRRLL